MNRIRFSLTLLLLAALMSPSASYADGGFFVDTLVTVTQAEAAANGLLSSSGQRAVLWQTGPDCWDLYLEPGTVQLLDTAWVLPLPVLPVVGEASEEFIDQLDAATVPVFKTTRDYLRFTYGGGSSGCCATDEAGDAGAEPQATLQDEEAPPEVSVWGQGSIGDLDYEVVSTETADALQTWLTDHDYVVPDNLAESIEPYVQDDFYFFVARIGREEGDAIKVPVLRFTLCDTPRLWYPLRLSTYSIAARLEFTVWLVNPAGLVSPSNCSWQPPGEFYQMYTEVWSPSHKQENREEIERPFEELYAEAIQDILSANGGRSLALQYAGPIRGERLDERLVLLEQAGATLPLSQGGEDWTTELETLVTDELLVTRWRGSFPASAMEIDLEFGVSAPVDQFDGIYWRHISYYNIDPPSAGEGDGLENGDGPDMATNSGSNGIARASLVGPHGRLKSASWFLIVMISAFGAWARRRLPGDGRK